MKMVILGIQDVGKTAFMVSSKLSLSGRNGPFFINVLNLRGLDGYKVDGDGYLERRREVKVLRNGTPVTAEVEHRRMDGTGPHGAFSIGWMEYPGGRLSDIEFNGGQGRGAPGMRGDGGRQQSHERGAC